MRYILLVMLLCAGSIMAEEKYRDTFYLIFRTRDFDKPNLKTKAQQNADMQKKLEDMRKRLGLDKRKMKFFRVGFQLPEFFNDALTATDCNSNRNTSSYHRQMGRPSFEWTKPLLASDPRYAQWYSRDNKTHGGGHRNPFSEIYGTFAFTAEEAWKHWEERLRNAAGNIAHNSSARFPFISISGPGEAGMNHQVPRKQDMEFTNWADTSPFAITEFRDWLTHRGVYGLRGRCKGQGWKGGRYFADDYSPAKARGRNDSFNAVFGTEFTTWDLKYWDLKRFKTMDKKDNPMPAAGQKGHIEGGFDAPREYKPGDLFWDVWDNPSQETPGFRQILVQHYNERTMQVLVEAGIPSERVFTHQVYVPETHATDGDWAIMQRQFLDAIPNWTARTKAGKVGFTMYGDPTLQNESFQAIWNLLTPIEKKYHQFALTEYHPFPKNSVAKTKTLDDFHKACDLIAKWRPHVVIVCTWEGNTFGNNVGYETKDTLYEEALREMIANWQDRPFWAVPDPSKH